MLETIPSQTQEEAVVSPAYFIKDSTITNIVFLLFNPLMAQLADLLFYK